MRWLVVMILVTACGKGSANEVCKRAAVKFEGCLKELVGPELTASLKDKQGIEACTQDDKTVAMYRACLDKPCDQFLDCIEGEVRASLPVVPKHLPREQQCQQHVKDGLRSIAMQTIMLDEIEKRSDVDKATAQACVIDESKPWTSCITAAERVEVDNYGKQRQKDCEQWDAATAACAFNQDPKCDHDMVVPSWREPREDAKPGPPVVWKHDGLLTVESDSQFLVWTADHGILIGDDRHLALTRDGKPVWTVAADLRHAVLAGRYVVASAALIHDSNRPDDDLMGLYVIDTKTGTAIRTLTKRYVSALGVAGDKVLALISNELYEITPSACARPTCAKKLAAFPDDDSFSTGTLAGWRDKIVQLSTSSLRVVDRKAKIVFELTDGNDDAVIALAGDTVAITDTQGVALVSLTKCAATGAKLELASILDLPSECTLATQKHHRLSSVHPALLSGGVLAFNDDDIIAKTVLLTPSGSSWETLSDGIGTAVADERFVYTVTNGPEGVRLLAIDRTSGKVAWATQLLAKAKVPDTLDTALAVRDGMIAVRINDVVNGLVMPL